VLYAQKNYAGAIEQYRTAATKLLTSGTSALDPVRIHNKWGDALYDQQKYPEAAEKYQQAIIIDPNSGNYERWLECLEKVDKDIKRKATEDVEKLINGRPEYANAYFSW